MSHRYCILPLSIQLNYPVLSSRLSSCQVAGTSGKVVLEGGSDDEGASTEAQGRAILDVLGLERRNDVLAAVYIVRADVSLSVRQVSGER